MTSTVLFQAMGRRTEEENRPNAENRTWMKCFRNKTRRQGQSRRLIPQFLFDQPTVHLAGKKTGLPGLPDCHFSRLGRSTSQLDAADVNLLYYLNGRHRQSVE
jgi:hypothetical protein